VIGGPTLPTVPVRSARCGSTRPRRQGAATTRCGRSGRPSSERPGRTPASHRTVNASATAAWPGRPAYSPRAGCSRPPRQPGSGPDRDRCL